MKENAKTGLFIGEICNLAKCTPRTVRHYETKGIVRCVAETSGGHKIYERETAAVIRTASVLSRLGYSLEDIGTIIQLPVLEEEDDAEKVRLEFLLASENRFPWDRANRGAFTLNACSKCYVICHPERSKKKR